MRTFSFSASAAASIFRITLIVAAIVASASNPCYAEGFREIVWIPFDLNRLSATLDDVLAKGVTISSSHQYVEKGLFFGKNVHLFNGHLTHCTNSSLMGSEEPVDNNCVRIGRTERWFINSKIQTSAMHFYDCCRAGVSAIFPSFAYSPEWPTFTAVRSDLKIGQIWKYKSALGLSDLLDRDGDGGLSVQMLRSRCEVIMSGRIESRGSESFRFLSGPSVACLDQERRDRPSRIFRSRWRNGPRQPQGGLQGGATWRHGALSGDVGAPATGGTRA
jgi:hypothetical protein